MRKSWLEQNFLPRYMNWVVITQLKWLKYQLTTWFYGEQSCVLYWYRVNRLWLILRSALTVKESKFAESQTAKMSKEVKFFMNQNQIWIKDTYLFCKMTVIYVILSLVNIEVFDFVILLCQNMEDCLLLLMKSREYEYFKTTLEKKSILI